MTRAFISSDASGQWFVITSAEDADEAQVTGEWVKTTDPVEVRA